MDDLEARFDANVRAAANWRSGKATPRRGEFGEWLRRLPTEHFDVPSVDSFHEQEDVLEDLTPVWRLMKRGGMVVCDDCHLQNHPEERNPRSTFGPSAPKVDPIHHMDAMYLESMAQIPAWQPCLSIGSPARRTPAGIFGSSMGKATSPVPANWCVPHAGAIHCPWADRHARGLARTAGHGRRRSLGQLR